MYNKYQHNPYNIPIEKYNCSGIYCIKVEGQIVYVGKAKNMLTRITQHIYNINTMKPELKYKVLYQFKQFKRPISFDVLEYVDKDKLDEAERKWIDEYKPILNTMLKY